MRRFWQKGLCAAILFGLLLLPGGCTTPSVIAPVSSPEADPPVVTDQPVSSPTAVVVPAQSVEDSAVELVVAGGEDLSAMLAPVMEARRIRLTWIDMPADAWRTDDLPEADLYILDSGYDLPALEAKVQARVFRALPREYYAGRDVLKGVLDHYFPFWNDGAGSLLAIPSELFSDEGRVVLGTTLYFRKDWSKRLGFSQDGKEADWTDLMPRIGAFAHGDPDQDGINQTYGITAGGWEQLTAFFLDDMGVRDWVLEDSQWIPGLMSQRAKDGLAWIRQLYRDGVLVPESFNQTEEEAKILFGQGRVGAWITDTANGVLEAWMAGHESDTEKKCLQRMGVYPLPVNPYGTRYVNSEVSSQVAMLSGEMDAAKVPLILDMLETVYELRQQAKPEYTDAVAMERAKVREETYLPYAWKSPLFTDWLGNNRISAFDVGIATAAHESLLDAAIKGDNLEEVWQAWLDLCNLQLDAGKVIAEVNEAAQARGIVTEE